MAAQQVEEEKEKADKEQRNIDLKPFAKKSEDNRKAVVKKKP